MYFFVKSYDYRVNSCFTTTLMSCTLFWWASSFHYIFFENTQYSFPIILLRSSLISIGWTFGFLLNRIHQHVINKASINWLVVSAIAFAQKMKFSIKDFSSKCDHIRNFLQIWSLLLKKFLKEILHFLCSVKYFLEDSPQNLSC